jgi:hypothetical protein
MGAKQLFGYQFLHNCDCRALHKDSPLTVLGKRLRGSKAGGDLIQPNKSRKVISWIWTNVDISDDSEAMHKATRVEWSKAWAQKRRWTEEVKLLEEEMH